MTRRLELLLVVAVAGLVACGGGGGGEPPVTPECTTHDACPAHEQCLSQSCEPLATGACRKEADCAATENCVAEVCVAVASCTTDDQCPAKQACTANACTDLVAPACHRQVDCDAGQTCTANVCVSSQAECDLPANVAERARLAAAQPVFGVRSKTAKTFSTSFASLGGNASLSCAVQLQFKDLNGDNTLQPYEDWTKPAATRAADLVGRLSAAERLALLAQPDLADVPASLTPALSAATQALVTGGFRFGRVTAANGAQLAFRAAWSNKLQEAAEATALGVPFVLTSDPAHSVGAGRTKARGWRPWPLELSFAAGGSLPVVEGFGAITAKEFRSIGVGMVVGVSADLATDPRWPGNEFTFGDDSAAVAERVAAYVRGLQGTALGKDRVAAVVGAFPGAGAAKDGLDARLPGGKFTVYPSGAFDAHLAPFQAAVGAGAAGVMTGYAIPQAGAWTGFSGALAGASVEQVGASFNAALVNGGLRARLGFGGAVLAPRGVLEDAALSPLGAPWGMESASRAERAAKAVAAGVDQFAGLADTAPLAAAKALAANPLTDAQVDAAAARSLAVAFRLGLFEDPYVTPAAAGPLAANDATYQASLNALNRGLVLLVNEPKPAGWLNGKEDANFVDLFDGTQLGDAGNAGNGTLRVLPAPKGEPYEVVGCNYYLRGAFDLDYVRGVAAGYGALTNDVSLIKQDDESTVPVSTEEQKAAWSDYVFVRVAAPWRLDVTSAELGLPDGTLEYAGADNATELAEVAWARAAIDSVPGSKAQLIVSVAGGRPGVVQEIMQYAPSGLYYEWGSNAGPEPTSQPDKVFLDVAFGIVDGRGRLPVGLPLSGAAAAAQAPDLAGDGLDPAFAAGAGLDTNKF